MKTAIVIVNFHSEKGIRRIKKGIGPHSAQGYAGRVIVIDNNYDNRGFAKAVNMGIKKALAEEAGQVLLVNPDIRITKRDMKELGDVGGLGDVVGPVLKFHRNGRWVFDLGGKVNWILGRTTHREFVGTKWELSRNLLDTDYVSGACMMVKREVFEKIGFFDERFFMYFEDVDFCLRAKRAGFKVAVDPTIIVEHDIAEHRKTGDEFKKRQNIRSNWIFVEKWVPGIFKPAAWVYLLVRDFKGDIRWIFKGNSKRL